MPHTTEDYRVRLDAFDGPLDLLLFLIRRAEVEIADIPVARIADQYMDHLRGLERIDIDAAGEFLVMAATLLEIKSRMLAPAPVEGGAAVASPLSPPDDDADPRTGLVRQLLEYKKYRDAATALEHRLVEWQRRYPAAHAAAHETPPPPPEELDPEDLLLTDLAFAFHRLAQTVNFDRLGEHEVQFDDTPIELHAEDVLERLRTATPAAEGASAGVSLLALFAGRSRGEMIGLFLATLELVRAGKVWVRQEAPGDPVLLTLADAAPRVGDE